jgi:hypothetical protein
LACDAIAEVILLHYGLLEEEDEARRIGLVGLLWASLSFSLKGRPDV